jgi:hypothetical protein
VCSEQSSTSANFALDNAQKEFLFPEYEIVVEPEELIGDDILNIETNKQTKIWDDAGKYTLHSFEPITADNCVHEETKGGADEEKDAKLTQKHYNKALSEQTYDPIYVNFLTRIDRSGKRQILRYSETSIHHTVTAQDPPPSSTCNISYIYFLCDILTEMCLDRFDGRCTGSWETVSDERNERRIGWRAGQDDPLLYVLWSSPCL